MQEDRSFLAAKANNVGRNNSQPIFGFSKLYLQNE